MVNRNYDRGRRAENKTCDRLRAVGYQAHRSAGSHGCWDVIGIRGQDVRLIQVKAVDKLRSNTYSELEREAFLGYACPKFCTKEIWIWVRGEREPLVEALPDWIPF